MKLRVKITLLCLAAMFLALGSCLGLSFLRQSSLLIQNAQDTAGGRLQALSSNLKTVNWMSKSQELNDTTRNSIAAYYFNSFVRVVKSPGDGFALVCDGEYLSNLSEYDLAEACAPGKTASISQGGRRLFLCSVQTRVVERDMTLYLCADLTDTYTQIREMGVWILLLALAALLLVALLVFFLVGHSLRPVQNLIRGANRIASGDYHLRIPKAREKGDEVGQLACAFNAMAGAVEEKVESLTQEVGRRKLLLGALTHELKTPMTAIVGYSDSILHMPLSPQEKDRCAQEIHRAALRTEALSQKMMELISLEETGQIQKERFLVSELLEGLEDYPVKVTAQINHVYGDRELLYTLLRNLLENARRASREDQPVQLVLSEQDGEWVLQVRDFGCGIPKEELENILEPFYRVDKVRSRKSGGAGLGLALCRQIVRCHGGTLGIQSEPGRGTTVTVCLPLGEALQR